MADERIVLVAEVGESERVRAVVVCLHVGEKADVDRAEGLVVGFVEPPADHPGEEAQRDHEHDDLSGRRSVPRC
jgi:hypothetical protein